MRKNLIARLILVGVISLSAVMPGLASSIDGGCVNHVVAPYSIDSFQVTLRGGQSVWIVRGAGSSDLDLSVYDEHDNQLAMVDDYSDNCPAFLARWTGTFNIVAVNRGSNYKQYAVCTN